VVGQWALATARGWSPARIAEHLATRPGWTQTRLATAEAAAREQGLLALDLVTAARR
jgi:hypothetical protein